MAFDLVIKQNFIFAMILVFVFDIYFICIDQTFQLLDKYQFYNFIDILKMFSIYNITYYSLTIWILNNVISKKYL